jgi:hypothetical protein
MLLVPATLAGGASEEGVGRVFKRVAVVGIDGAEGTTGRAVARCPKGSRVVSGGWFITDPEETELLVYKSKRLRKRGWVVSAIQATANSFYSDLLALAYCDRDAPRERRVSTTRTVASGETGTAAAECPKGKKAVAGGFSVPPTRFNERGFPIESRRIRKRTWRTVVHAPYPAGARVTVYAYCSRRVGHLRKRSRSSPIGNIGDYAETSSRRCPRRIGARAGGFSIRNKTDALYSIPLSVDDDERRWRVSARNLGGPPSELRSFAYCS